MRIEATIKRFQESLEGRDVMILLFFSQNNVL